MNTRIMGMCVQVVKWFCDLGEITGPDVCKTCPKKATCGGGH
jgi:hypothetical protein